MQRFHGLFSDVCKSAENLLQETCNFELKIRHTGALGNVKANRVLYVLLVFELKARYETDRQTDGRASETRSTAY